MSKTTDFKEGKAGVKVVYFTSKTLADGSHPFLVRITKDRQRKYIAIGESLLPKYWNPDKSGFREAIRKSYPDPSRDRLIVSYLVAKPNERFHLGACDGAYKCIRCLFSSLGG